MFLFRLRVSPAATSRVLVGQNSYAPGEYFFLTSDDIDKYISRKLKDSGLVAVDREATGPEYTLYTTTAVNEVDDSKEKYYLERWNLFFPPLNPSQGDIIFYDGSDWVSLAAGTDGDVLTTHGAGADPTWEVGGGSANGYDTIWFPAASMTSRITDGSLFTTHEFATNKMNLDMLAFDPTNKEYADFSFIMPEQWDLGTIKAKFAWTYASVPGAGTKVEWALSGVAIADVADIDVATGTPKPAADVISTPYFQHLTPATAAITIGGAPILGKFVNFTIYRNAATDDDLNVDALLIGVWIQYNKTVTPAIW
jgi:hypothetical protein